jgi:hypothetical protein
VTPDPEVIGRLLMRIESDAHRRGWDESPDLYVLYDARDHESDSAYRNVLASRRGPAVRVAPYAAQSAVPQSALDGNPAHALFRFALNVSGGEHPAVEYVLATLRQRGFLGLAFLHEGWTRTVASQEERAALGDVRFADIPGSVEMRFVAGYDIAGVDYVVSRARGKSPELHSTSSGDFKEVTGAIYESLRIIVAKVAGLPVPEWENVPSRWDWDAERGNAI